MKKLLTLALVLSLGVFCAIGCAKKEPAKTPKAPTGTEAGAKAPEGAPADKAPADKAPADKAPADKAPAAK